MPLTTREPAGATSPAAVNDPRIRRRFGRLAWIAAAYTFALILFGGIVRITGSGLGCGDDWPLCNGQWIPPFEFATLIEYTHRLLAAALFIPFGLVAWYAWKHRGEDGFGGRRGAARPVAWVFALLVVQVLLGALTVKLELPAAVSAVHFVTANLILGGLILAAVRVAPPARDADPRNRRFAGSAVSAAIFGLVIVAFGALTANTGIEGAMGPSRAALACQGFPLCNGQWIPTGGGLVHLQLTHRVLAYLFFLHLTATTILAWRRGAPRAVAWAATASLTLVVAQIGVAASLVLRFFPDELQILHLAVGVTLWACLVLWAAIARRAVPA
jgi:heme A synthase